MKATILAIAIGLSLPVTSADAADGALSHPGLSRGRRVQIKGRVRADGTIEARRIRLRDPDDASKIEGRVTVIDANGQRIRIGGFDVSTAAYPLVYANDAPASLTDLAVGQIVEAKGYWASRRLHAARLRIRSSGAETRTDVQEETEIESDIDGMDWYAGGLLVLGRTVRLAAGGKVVDERTRQDPLDWSGRRLRRDEDDRQVPPIRVGDWLVIGGRIGGEVRGERSFGSDPEARSDGGAASGELLASAALSRNIELYGRARTTREFEIDDERNVREIGQSHRVVEAALSVEQIAGRPVGLQVGRQRFRDAREWFFDDYLDAAMVHVTLSSWRFEAAVANAIFAGPEQERRRREQPHAIVSIARRLGERTTATAIAIARDDRNRGERPLWVGASIAGRPTRRLKYWGNAAARRGSAGPIKLQGWGADGAVAYRFSMRGAPAISAGYAAASGDDSRSDGVDSTFRQTGLNDNTARFHGLKRFAYYGEVFDPELSNIDILTAGTGMRPIAGASVDVVYHRYRQRRLRRSLPSNGLDATGTGRSADLGDEIDLIVSVQRFARLDISVVAGIFRPGAAIASPVKPARFWKPQIRLFF